jgi:hypothetical protein
MAGRVTYTGLAEAMAGCYECHGEREAHWQERNAVAVAARHHDATGHRTWWEQTIVGSYGLKPEDKDA